MANTLRLRLRGEDGLRQIREFVGFLRTIGRSIAGATTISTRTTDRVEIPPLFREDRIRVNTMRFRITKLVNKKPGDDYSYVVRHYQLTDPRSDYYVDHWDPTTKDYGNYYRQEYNDTKDYVQALRAEEEAAAAEALRAPQAAQQQQGVLARLRRPLPPPFDDAEDYLGALFAIGGLARRR